MLSEEQHSQWNRDGFVRIPGFADAAVRDAMLRRVVEIIHLQGAAAKPWTPFIQMEAAMDAPATLEAGVSKVFRLHRDSVFEEFCTDPRVLDLVSDLIGEQLDCFLSQFIFKNPGAWGQPWHQDEYYFRFDRAPQVGVWLAVTEATLENGCLHVVPGSHREPIHDHIKDDRPGANFGYVEIVDHDMSASQPVLMAPGDLLLFHSHLMHRSTDNESSSLRAAMVYHYAKAGTVDSTASPVNDWVEVRR